MTLCSVVLLDKLLRFVCGVICISSIVLWLWHIRIGILRLLADWCNTLLLYCLVVFWLGSPWCVVGSIGSVIDCSERQYVHMVDNLLKSPFALSCEVLELCTTTYQGSICGDNPCGGGYTDRTPSVDPFISSENWGPSKIPAWILFVEGIYSSQPCLKTEWSLAKEVRNVQALVWSRSCRQALAVVCGLCWIVETRLDIVVGLSLGKYALAGEEFRVAMMKSICCMGVRVGFSMLRWRPREWNRDRALLEAVCASITDTPFRNQSLT